MGQGDDGNLLQNQLLRIAVNLQPRLLVHLLLPRGEQVVQALAAETAEVVAGNANVVLVEELIEEVVGVVVVAVPAGQAQLVLAGHQGIEVPVDVPPADRNLDANLCQ